MSNNHNYVLCKASTLNSTKKCHLAINNFYISCFTFHSIRNSFSVDPLYCIIQQDFVKVGIAVSVACTLFITDIYTLL